MVAMVLGAAVSAADDEVAQWRKDKQALIAQRDRRAFVSSDSELFSAAYSDLRFRLLDDTLQSLYCSIWIAEIVCGQDVKPRFPVMISGPPKSRVASKQV
jgi:hypothetical protein